MRRARKLCLRLGSDPADDSYPEKPFAVYCGKMVYKVRVFKSHWHLPRSKPIRIGLGILLVAFGLLGFLPVLGFWMIPVGLLVLSVDLPVVRRWRRKLTVWWHRHNEHL
jgi:hypothetical protein